MSNYKQQKDWMCYGRECVVEWTHNNHAMIRRPEGRRDWVPVEHLEPWRGQLKLDFGN